MINNWFELIQQKLDLTWLSSPKQPVPFALAGAVTGKWQSDSLECIGSDLWKLIAHSDSGLEGTWQVQFFPDTRSLECFGSVINRGSGPVCGIRQCMILDICLLGRQVLGQPWLRTVNGVGVVPPGYFPPYDFAVVDRQLLNIPMPRALIIDSGPQGWSSEGNLPCAILCNDKQTFGLGLFMEWSGLWYMMFKFEPGDTTAGENQVLRCQAGYWGLDLDLQPGQSLPLPRLLITAFDGNLETGGNALRRHIYHHVTPRLGDELPVPPTSFNHYFAFRNDISAENLKPAVEYSAAAGLEYFCVDASWFIGKFRERIGNWEEDRQKFPEGIASFSRFVQSKGMKYGTWFEPEWAHEDSPLYRQHTEWFWPTPSRHILAYQPGQQYFHPDCHLINLGLPQVRQWWLDRIVRAYEQWDMRWLRWDFNQIPRPNWEYDVPAGQLGWRQIEHVSGLYQLLDNIRKACPDLLIEQCAAGGHRIDLGTIRRGHTFWMNDHTTNSDIIRAMQLGLNTVLPGNYANTNICQARHDYNDYDFLSHGAGGLGYSGRLWEAPKHDFQQFCEAVKRFKGYRHLLTANFHLDTNPPCSTDDYTNVTFSSRDQSVTMEFNFGCRSGQARLRWKQPLRLAGCHNEAKILRK